ncbi:hypothetical protein GBN16_00870 [Plesiomonas shigelloides]|nr:hypothetical protein GBN16_00870 [Plesiomonas shigelloides]
MEHANREGDRFFVRNGGLLSDIDCQRLTDTIPLVYSATEREILGWRIPTALRRYSLALARLKVSE